MSLFRHYHKLKVCDNFAFVGPAGEPPKPMNDTEFSKAIHAPYAGKAWKVKKGTQTFIIQQYANPNKRGLWEIVNMDNMSRVMENAKLSEIKKYVFDNFGVKLVDSDSIKDELVQSASKEALGKNIATEIKAGKDPKQAAAIAYNVQKENKDCSVKDDLGYKPDICGCMDFTDIENIVHTTIQYIKAKYPNEQNTMEKWLSLIGEEFGELCQAINDGDVSNVLEEGTQTIAAIYLMLSDFVINANVLANTIK